MGRRWLLHQVSLAERRDEAGARQAVSLDETLEYWTHLAYEYVLS